MDQSHFYITLEDNVLVEIAKTSADNLDDLMYYKAPNQKIIELTEGQYNMLWVYLTYMGGNFDSVTDFIQKIRA